VGAGGLGAGPESPKSVLLRDFALSGSGTEVKGAHILDPRTGRPASGHIAAWAAHRSAAFADALSTAFMVMATAEVEAFCRRHPDVWALVVAAGGRVSIFNRDRLPG
jgi:thiamine biosynthesis lipoprotein